MKKYAIPALVVLSIIGLFSVSYTAQEILPTLEEQQATLSSRNDELDKRLQGLELEKQGLELEKQGIELEKRINSLKWESLEVQKRVRDNISEGL